MLIQYWKPLETRKPNGTIIAHGLVNFMEVHFELGNAKVTSAVISLIIFWKNQEYAFKSPDERNYHVFYMNVRRCASRTSRETWNHKAG